MKIFQMTDGEWWRAESLEDAIASMIKGTGIGMADLEEAKKDGYCRELTLSEINTLKYVDNNPDEVEPEAGWPERTFAEQLRLEDEAGSPAGVFAVSHDYL